MKNMLNFKNFSAEELQKILDLALDMKKNPEKYSHALEGKKLYTLFEKTSTRTFLSFTTGMTELGGTYNNQLWKDSNFVLGEPVSEIKYVCRNVDIIMARLVKNETVELFGDNVTVPFINGCDNSYHPCQILADALTIIEKFGSLNVTFLYIGAKNNVFNSLVEFFSKMKQGTLYGLTPLVNDTACGPDFYEEAKKTGYYVELDPNMPMDEVKKYVKDMDICYTDTWLDMEFFNDPAYQDKKKELMDKMMPYQLNDEFLEGSHALVFHDMPMHVGFEISMSYSPVSFHQRIIDGSKCFAASLADDGTQVVDEHVVFIVIFLAGFFHDATDFSCSKCKDTILYRKSNLSLHFFR